MPGILQLTLSPAEAADLLFVEQFCKDELALAPSAIIHIEVIKKSIDARSRRIKVNLSVQYYLEGESFESKSKTELPENLRATSQLSSSAYVVGAGPAGLFACLRLLNRGIKPILIERGKNVKERRRDLAALTKHHLVNPESNYCFGEGGAGTYSDGKLYTRSSKRGNIREVLEAFVFFGASPEILIEAHPHIGTNKLPAVIENIREYLLQHGAEIYFQSKLVDVEINNHCLQSIVVQDLESGNINSHVCSQLILATGHSARDIYQLLQQKKVGLAFKPFALGVRMEHPQELIDSIQYHCNLKEVKTTRENLPAASYSLVTQAQGKGVYSFCMCPGGIIAPCATSPGEVVTNGWSPSKRNNPFANSGLVVSIELDDVLKYQNNAALAGMFFQQEVEQKAWQVGGMTQCAPAQRLVDFLNNKTSADLPECSYIPGVKSVDLRNVLPQKVAARLHEGLNHFLKQKPGLNSREGILVATESRTSTPVRIPRDVESLQHPELKGLFPCGEGAGYAGGIVSAAMDGIACAGKV
jgi:uncharacterized protein